MTTSRRTLLAAGVSGTLALTAGCLDFIRGDGPLELEAERVAPSESALEEAGYEEHEIERETIHERVDVGVEREVSASVWLSSYATEIEYQGHEHDGAFFAAISVPDVSVAGYSANPIDGMSNEELLEEFHGELDGEYDAPDDLSHRESFGLDILGDGREVDVFEGETELDGERIEIDVVVSSFAHEDDVLILLGSYPAALADESVAAEELMESVEHPV
ncbi:DUF6517 family protein [Natronolimnohabitans sp. A-GB9]|uniref:DUF6517 family protein n=1 Tax=Natronolimnohabitans sp. A-GB9 TaxID=3069757 RepID=UPI0027B3C5CE|nr:DUF6517 family protein [Natronolimnohabitans sp. A-GB9]MDQ2052501.1 DUF6517 family protein [Natronolimnohabitans sp. A-GB9]